MFAMSRLIRHAASPLLRRSDIQSSRGEGVINFNFASISVPCGSPRSFLWGRHLLNKNGVLFMRMEPAIDLNRRIEDADKTDHDDKAR